MGNLVKGWLRKRGFEPVVAYYQPYSLTPRLSVPSFALFSRRPGCSETILEGEESHAIGAWLPELEFTHYLPTMHWRSLIASCDFHLAVVGHSLPALALSLTRTPFLSWAATSWEGDRTDRAGEFPLIRRAVDRMVVRPIAGRCEKRVLNSGRTLALSDYARRELDRAAGRLVVAGVLSAPIDTNLFVPQPSRVEPGLIGLIGRYDDARKNARLFIETIGALRRGGAAVRGVLIGGRPTAALRQYARELGVSDVVQFLEFVPLSRVVQILSTIDVFLITSRQEGLCIAGLEAMSAGTPVVSTRCGGPEEYVLDGETGYLTGFDPEEMAPAIRRVVENRTLRATLATGARRLVESRYSLSASEAVFWREFEMTFRTETEERQSG